MIQSWISSIFFVISFIAFWSGIFCFQRSDKRENGIVWFPFSLVLLIAVNAFMCGIINLVHVPINIISVGVVDILGAGILWFLILKKNARQQFYWKISDIIIMAILLVIVLVFSRNHFEGFLLMPNFQAVDAPKHMILSLDMMHSQRIESNMFYADLYGALFMEALSPLVSVAEFYKLFVLSEICNLLLAGMSFCALLLAQCNNRKNKIFAAIISILYLLGYPLHNTIFGFVYWGMSVTLITCLMYFVVCYVKNEFNHIICSCIILLIHFGIFESYALFVPPVFLASFLYIAFQKWKHKELLQKNTIIDMIIMYLPAVVVGLVYSFALIRHANVAAVSTAESTPAIAREGGIYKDLYRDYIFFLPLALVALGKELRKRKISMAFFMFIIVLTYMVIMFVGGMHRAVSSYYYCKNNYLMWFILLYLAFMGVKYLSIRGRDIVYAYFFTWGLIALVFVTKAEETIASRNENFAITLADNYMNIYAYNRAWDKDARYNRDYLELYTWTYENLTRCGESTTVSADFYLNEYWFQAVNDQTYDVYMSDYQRYLSEQEANADFICVLYDSFYEENKEHYDSMKRIFQNDAGFVAMKE